MDPAETSRGPVNVAMVAARRLARSANTKVPLHTPFSHISFCPLNTPSHSPCQHLSTHPVDPPCEHTLLPTRLPTPLTHHHHPVHTKGFANARSVRIKVEESMSRASQRQSQELQQHRVRRSSGDLSVAALKADHASTLTLPDVLGPPPDVENDRLIKQLLGMTGLGAVKNAMEGLMNIVRDNYRSELRGDKVADPALHRMFLGNPGTGKTTVANLYGKVT